MDDSVGDQSKLSYKFQRLRERLRQAILTGELVGKLPGERILAERFDANAKTLSKALTDLAAEGLLERSIGRGTYVRGSAPAAPKADRWLIVTTPEGTDDPIVRALTRLNPHAVVTADVSDIRPSFLAQVGGLIDFSDAIPDAFLRDIVVRGIPVVVAGHEPRTYSTHCTLLDLALGAGYLGRDLILGNHRKIAAIERNGTTIRDTLQNTASYFSREAAVFEATVDSATSLASQGVSAFVCDTHDDARQTIQALKASGYDVPGRVSVAAIGATDGTPACSGYFVTPAQYADAIISLLREDASKRPTTLWLTGPFADRGTIRSQGTASASHVSPTLRLASGIPI